MPQKVLGQKGKGSVSLAFISQSLLSYFHAHGRILPWRKPNIDAYHVWVSEIMLQQTQVSRVILYYEKFVARFPSVEALAAVSWREFLPYYAGLGYYRRGRNMLLAAKKVIEKFKGKFPKNYKELLTLPGVGPYTAAAILSFAYDQDILAVDTNLQRVFGRYLFGYKRAKIDFDRVSRGVTKNKRALNAAVMDFANDICVSRPKCKICPLRKRCEYAKTKGALEVSSKKPKIHFPVKEAQVYLWLHENHKEYFSKNPDDFEVFVLDASKNSRKEIKKYFKSEYNLDLAVRPPHKRVFVGNKPTLFVNAQILLGKHEFGSFKKEDIEDFYKAGESR
jgi:A/G-specific adenine glycosylase